MPAVVFLTAYDEFAVRAFEAQALDYLVKPVSEERFATTMKRLMRQLESGAGREQVIVVPTSRGTVVVPLREVDWIEAADNYARIWTGGRSYLLREPLRALEPRMRSDGFVRAHRRALVPIGKVSALKWTPNGELVAVLVNGISVRVSRRQRAAFAAAVRARSV
jgi:two-component system LytT family response regulator